MENFHIALRITNPTDGLSRSDICDLYDMLGGERVFPVTVIGKNLVAIGFLTVEAARKLNFQGSGLGEFVKEILDDESQCEKCAEYWYQNVHVWISE